MNQTRRAVITAMGHYHPENIIENSFFDSLEIGSDGHWVEDRTGIRSRRSVLAKKEIAALSRGEKTLEDLRKAGLVMSIAEMAERSWHVLLNRNPHAANQIDLLSCGTSVPDYDIPANACTIAGRIGVEASSFDVNSACSSFVVNLHALRSFILAGTARKAVCFTPERYSLRLNYRDRSSCVLFGDGCAAAAIELNATSGFEIIDTIVTSSPSKFDLVQIPDSTCFNQNGAAVQKFAITRTIEITLEILERNGYTLKDLQYLIGHQANLRMLTSAIAKLGLPENKHLYNVDEFGNQGGAGAPAVMSTHWDRFQSGDLVVVSVVGSGLTWASALLRRL